MGISVYLGLKLFAASIHVKICQFFSVWTSAWMFVEHLLGL